ncbi:MAG: hypothetical protein HZB71_12965 [Betaproteobacteria bacterium]|nr:hypothetical protein [Betaproteobacteria bacterium]
MKNVIILTGGLAGSSVLTSMFHKVGYWVGDSTKQKHDYNTWENADLVDLNNQIIRDVGFTDDWTMNFHPDFVTRVSGPAANLDPAPFEAFVQKCSEHPPWIWKDPRLWLTIRHWIRFLDPSNVCFVTIKREHLQSWISTTLRRQIQTMDYAARYDDGIHETILEFLQERGLPYYDILYEDLLMQPERVLQGISDISGAPVNMDVFRAVFRGRLHQKQHGLKSFLHASAIYLKNYGERYR